ncbi:MAG: class I tRNA ligase family protein, partial [Acetobacteraceae bacterium]
NSAVARLYELARALADAEQGDTEPGMAAARREGMKVLLRLAAPMIPHLAEELHARLDLRVDPRADPGSGALVAEMPWPEADPALVVAESVTIAVQVAGRLRATILVSPGTPEAEILAAAAAEPNVVRAVSGRRIVRRIYVPERVVNFVVSG